MEFATDIAAWSSSSARLGPDRNLINGIAVRSAGIENDGGSGGRSLEHRRPHGRIGAVEDRLGQGRADARPGRRQDVAVVDWTDSLTMSANQVRT